MIYLVSRNQTLFNSSKYKNIIFKKVLKILKPLKWVQFDTETEGLDPFTKKLLTVQLGNKDNQIVFDWQTLSNNEKIELKEYFESDRIFIGWNLMFDLCFMYVQNIWIKHIWDGMIADQLIFLGYPSKLSVFMYNKLHLPFYEAVYEEKTNELKTYSLSHSLKAAAKRWCDIDIDKTVRGKIIDVGLTEDVIVYAAGDVMYLEDIKEQQDKEIEKQNLKLAVEFECEFVKSLAYFKYCGIHLDIDKWKAKMQADQKILDDTITALNQWVINWDLNNPKRTNIIYPTLNITNQLEAEHELKTYIKSKNFIRCPSEDLDSPEGPILAFKKVSTYTKIDRQGDLFNGFDTDPKCMINWNSDQQVIPLFEDLGINVETFDKETKKKKKSVDAKLLKPQADKFPILPIYLKYKKASKLVSTYGQNWLDAVNPVTGRIHVELHSIGTNTARVSSGGGVYKLNLQNLPNDAITRACFTSIKGNKWISADYQSQESRIIASVSKDKAMIELFEHGCGDVHSLVAKMSYPEVIGDCPIEEIKDKYHLYRQNAKGIEFAINYGGDANTIANNKGIPLKEAEQIYNNFMKGFPGVYKYQEYCRKAVMKNGYILMNPITKHRGHIYDWVELNRIQNKFNEPGFWEYYREMKTIDSTCDTVKDVRYYFSRKAELGKDSINYRIQDRGAMAFKLSSIKLFNWIIANNYQNIVKMCVPAHDEFNLECPEEMAQEVADVLVQCMIDGGKPFCPNVFLGADVNIDNYWVH